MIHLAKNTALPFFESRNLLSFRLLVQASNGRSKVQTMGWGGQVNRRFEPNVDKFSRCPRHGYGSDSCPVSPESCLVLSVQ